MGSESVMENRIDDWHGVDLVIAALQVHLESGMPEKSHEHSRNTSLAVTQFNGLIPIRLMSVQKASDSAWPPANARWNRHPIAIIQTTVQSSNFCTDAATHERRAA